MSYEPRPPHEHTREVLGSSGACLIERCDCGTLHVSVGPLTFRVHADTAEDLWSILGVSLARLASRTAGTDEVACLAMASRGFGRSQGDA